MTYFDKKDKARERKRRILVYGLMAVSLFFIVTIIISALGPSITINSITDVPDCNVIKGKKVFFNTTDPNSEQLVRQIKEKCYEYLSLDSWKAFEIRSFGHEIPIDRYQIRINE